MRKCSCCYGNNGHYKLLLYRTMKRTTQRCFFCVFSLLWFEVSITNLDFQSRFTVSSIIFHRCVEEYGQRLGMEESRSSFYYFWHRLFGKIRVFPETAPSSGATLQPRSLILNYWNMRKACRLNLHSSNRRSEPEFRKHSHITTFTSLM